MNNTQIGNRIKSRRKELNLTLKDIANIVGVASSTIQRYENGTISQIKLPVLEAIAKAINVNPTWLVKENAKMEINSVDDINMSIKRYKNLSKKEILLLKNFNKLNDLGKEKLIEYSNDLIETPKYIHQRDIATDLITATKEEPESLEEMFTTIAAHDDDLTDEEKKEMDRRILEALKNSKN